MVEMQLKIANQILELFEPNTRIERRPGGFFVVWQTYQGEKITRRFSTFSGGSFYPVWHRKWGHGGTCCVALTQLVRWLQGKSVLPLSTWQYWCGDSVQLIKGDKAHFALNLLSEAGYPNQVVCVFCGQVPIQWDWYYIKGQMEGCGCYCGTGCKAQGL